MGRRATHTTDDLRKLILEAAWDIVEAQGLAGLSARTIARRIGYSPGTLYNVFTNIDEIVLRVEARLLEQLIEHVETATQDCPEPEHLQRLAAAYLEFTRSRPRLWALLFEHSVMPPASVPGWYRCKIEQLLGQVQSALQSTTGESDAERLGCSARVLWAGFHGITILAATDKLTSLSPDLARSLIEDLVATYVAGHSVRHLQLAS